MSHSDKTRRLRHALFAVERLQPPIASEDASTLQVSLQDFGTFEVSETTRRMLAEEINAKIEKDNAAVWEELKAACKEFLE